ncbi:MAG: hypothetical protein ACRD3Q_18705 [Terriglobales bacterium]
MSYLKGTLSAFAALTIVVFGPVIVMAIRYRDKATGIDVILFGKELLSPVFWLCFLLIFGLFWMAGRLGNKFLRVLVFWIPAASISAIGCIVLTFVLYVYFHFHRA